MRLTTRLVRWSIAPGGAARGRTTRDAILVEATTPAGTIGLGEAAPLPEACDPETARVRKSSNRKGAEVAEDLPESNLSSSASSAPLRFSGRSGPGPSGSSIALDTLAHAERAIASFTEELRSERAPWDPERVRRVRSGIASASARFAIETALLDAIARERGVPLAELLVTTPASEVPLAAVVDDVNEARAAVNAGVRCLKIKVGPEGDLERVFAIAAAAPGARLRLDANRSWPAGAVGARMAQLAALDLEFIEEPCLDAHRLLGERLPCRIALDESLIELSRAELDAALRSAGLAALVLKPTRLGGLSACLELAGRARAAGVAPIVSHALEGPIGTAACAELARAIGGEHAVGLGSHPAIGATLAGLGIDRDRIAADPPLAEPGIDRDRIAADPPLAEPGIDRDRIAADPLATSRVRADAVPARCQTLIATPSHETIAAIAAAFDARRPIALLHPKLPEGELARQDEAIDGARLAGDAAVVLFTSGSTGTPRGVVLSRAAVIAAAEASAAHLGWEQDDRWLLALPMAHTGGLAVVLRCLLAARPVVLVEPHHTIAERLADCTLASLVPAQLAALLDDDHWRPPRHLRAILLGGAAAPAALLARAAARGVPFLATYGLTETFGQVATAQAVCAGDPEAQLVPLPGVSIQGGTREAPAVLRVRGPMLATCYLDGAPIAPELATNDLGFLEHGALHVVGRADDTIITGGENVQPQAVEAVLAATPGVRAACVFGVTDARWGQIVGAAVAVDATFDLDAAAAGWHAGLAPHARPREVAVASALPVLANAKIDRRAAALLPRARLSYRRSS